MYHRNLASGNIQHLENWTHSNAIGGPLAHIWPVWQCSDRLLVLRLAQLTANCSFSTPLTVSKIAVSHAGCCRSHRSCDSGAECANSFFFFSSFFGWAELRSLVEKNRKVIKTQITVVAYAYFNWWYLCKWLTDNCLSVSVCFSLGCRPALYSMCAADHQETCDDKMQVSRSSCKWTAVHWPKGFL